MTDRQRVSPGQLIAIIAERMRRSSCQACTPTALSPVQTACWGINLAEIYDVEWNARP